MSQLTIKKAEMLGKLINYFVSETKGHLTKIQLVKFIYLADLYTVKWTGQQLTDLDWRYYFHGPWADEIEQVLNKMNGHEICVQRVNQAILIGIGPAIVPLKKLNLPLGLELILSNIRREWATSDNKRFQQMLDYVYGTAPMLEAQAHHHPQEKVRLNLYREREKLEAELGGID